MQEGNGSWVQGNSNYALPGPIAYNTRVAWALIALGLETDDARFIKSGEKNIDFTADRFIVTPRILYV